MLPNLKPGQSVVTFNWYPSQKLKVGDLIVIKVDDRLIVKRLGKINHQGFFVVGDNPEQSTDSRHFGLIDKNNLVGKVIYIYPH